MMTRTRSESSVAVEPAPVDTIERVALLTDLSPASDEAFAHAAQLAESFEARLTLVHAVAHDADASDGRREVREEAERRQERAAKESLELLSERTRAPTDVVVGRMSAVAELARRLQTLGPDLVVAATHGREGLARLVFGSVVESLLRERIAPMLVLREPSHGGATAFRRLLVATDLSHGSRRAFPLAATVAKRYGAKVTGLYVSRLPRSRSVFGASYAVDSAIPGDDVVARFLGRDFSGLEVHSVVEVGDPADRIVETARREHADAIVLVANERRTDFRSRLLGSVTERVLRTAPCPVLVIP